MAGFHGNGHGFDPHAQHQMPHGAGGGGAHHQVVKERSTYLSDSDAEKLCEMFAEGLESGSGYARILAIMERQGIEPKLVQLLRTAILEKGDKLGEAFARFGILDARARQLILVSESQGTTPEVFRLLSRSYGMRYRHKLRVVRSMISPAALIGLATIALPAIFGNFDVLVAAPSVVAMASKLLTAAALEGAVFALGFVVVSYAWLNLPVDMVSREVMGRVWMRFPVVSDSSRTMALAKFCRFLRNSIHGGMNIFQGLELSADASGHPYLNSRMPQVIDRLNQGSTLCQALSVVPDLPNDLLDHIGIGEETGRLEERLDFLADKFQRESEERFDVMIENLTKFAIFCIVIFALLVAFSNVAGLLPQG